MRAAWVILLTACVIGLTVVFLDVVVERLGPSRGLWPGSINGMIALAGLVVLGLIGFRYARRGEADLRRITRLNNILRAIQNINQLAVRERDSRNLLTQAGKILVDALGFRRVLAVQTDSSCRVVHAACSGSALPADQAGQLQEGQPIPVAWASCLERAEVHIGTQPAPACAGCPGADAAEGVLLCSRLAHAGNVHGMMSIELAAKALPTQEDVAMLSELAGDIALAIDAIEQEKVLAQERRFIQTVLDATGALIAVLDRQGRITYVNRACEEATGYRLAYLRGKPLWEVLIHPEEVKSVQAMFADLKAGNFPCTHTNPWQTKDGQRREVEWLNTALTDEQGEVEYVIKAGIDVTERKRAAVKRDLAAAERAQFEAGYRDLIERGPAIVYHAPPEGPDQVPSYVSPQITARLGIAEDEYLADPDRWLHPDDRARVKQQRAHLRDTGEPFLSQYRMLSAEGRVLYFQEHAAVVRSLEGEALFVQGLILPTAAP